MDPADFDSLQPSEDPEYNTMVQEAWELLEEVGYRGLTREALAERLLVPLAEVTRWFPDELSLAIAILKHRDVSDIVSVRTVVVDGGVANPLASLHELMAVNARQPRTLELYSILSASSLDRDHPAHGYFRQRYSESREIMADLVKDVSGDPVGTAVEIMAVMDGLQLQWLRDPQAFDLVEEWDIAARRIVTHR